MYRADNYHDLVDMPFFVGEFMMDSAKIVGKWVRLATYPAGSVTGGVRQAVWRVLEGVIPAEVAVFGEAPFANYTVMQIADPSFGGASGLEHQSSHVDVVFAGAVDNPFMPSLYAHEIFHAWNVKRLRPAEMWPYDYSDEQPTPWLWVSEGITDYYADLALVRGGVMDSLGFFASTGSKIQEVAAAPPVALEDASLSTWIHPADGTAYIYYSKGSLAGLLLDIAIRDASDNHASLDSVMRRLYQQTYKVKRGFTAEDWWGAVTAAAGEHPFDEFARRYIDGREPLPFDSLLPLAGMRLVVDTIREPQLGINTLPAEDGSIVVQSVLPGSSADEAGVLPGDVLVSVGNVRVDDQQFGAKFRANFRNAAGQPLQIGVKRGDRLVALNGTVQIGERYDSRIEAVANASPKAVRIREGILHGRVQM
jgi:predicted metalloprotease with PDZ domain